MNSMVEIDQLYKIGPKLLTMPEFYIVEKLAKSDEDQLLPSELRRRAVSAAVPEEEGANTKRRNLTG